MALVAGTRLGTFEIAAQIGKGDALDAAHEKGVMLTGRIAFPGETLSDTMVAILDRAPDWSCSWTGCSDASPGRGLHKVSLLNWLSP